MKLIPLVEVTAPIPASDLIYLEGRPMETEADLIAAAAPRGEIYDRRLFSLHLDEHEEAVRSPEEPICIPCEWSNEQVFGRLQLIRRAELLRLGIYGDDEAIPYDPTIRL
jgi:hypothetical protein